MCYPAEAGYIDLRCGTVLYMKYCLDSGSLWVIIHCGHSFSFNNYYNQPCNQLIFSLVKFSCVIILYRLEIEKKIACNNITRLLYLFVIF